MGDPGTGVIRIGNALASATVAATGAATLMAVPIVLEAPLILPYIVIFAFIVAAGHAVLIGLPLYFLLSRVWGLRWHGAAFGGAAVGVGPAAVFAFLPPLLRDPQSVVISDMLGPAAWLAASGTAGGLAFWLVIRPRADAPFVGV